LALRPLYSLVVTGEANSNRFVPTTAGSRTGPIVTDALATGGPISDAGYWVPLADPSKTHRVRQIENAPPAPLTQALCDGGLS
jgi:hypothetical protein